MSTPTPYMPYEMNEDPPASWRQAIDALPWQTTELDGTVLWYQKSGACPHCLDTDGIRASIEAEGYLGLGPEEDTDVFVPCRCTGEHGHPTGVTDGCGWGGYVSGPGAGSGQ